MKKPRLQELPSIYSLILDIENILYLNPAAMFNAIRFHLKFILRTFIFCILFCFVRITSFGQVKNIASQEINLKKLYEKAISTSDDKNDLNDSLFTKFGSEFTRFIENNPGTLEYTFKAIAEILTISTSDDNNLRIYSWDDGTGGTMRFYNQIIQFKSGGKVHTFIPKRLKEGDPGEYCSKIYHINANSKNFYFPINNSKGSSKDLAQSISCYTIENNKLSDTTRIFKTRTKFLKRIEVGYDFFTSYNHKGDPIEFQKKDNKNIYLKIAIVNKKFALTPNNLVYKFNGKNFDFIGSDSKK